MLQLENGMFTYIGVDVYTNENSRAVVEVNLVSLNGGSRSSALDVYAVGFAANNLIVRDVDLILR